MIDSPRKNLHLLIGITIGVLVVAIVLFLLQVYLNSPITAQAPTTFTSASTSTVTNPAASSPPVPTTNSTIIVPKSVSGESFYLAINAVVSDMQSLATMNNELTPILQEISSKSTKMDYSGILTLLSNARAIVANGVSANEKFRADVERLSASQFSVTDASVQQETTSFVTSSRDFTATLSAYFSSLTPILVGGFPNQRQIDAVTVAVQNLTVSNTKEAAQLKTLLELLNTKTLEFSKTIATP